MSNRTRPAGGPAPRVAPAIARERNPLTPEEAAALAFELTRFEQGAGDAARMLLLCFSFTFADELPERERMLRAVEARLAPFVAGFDDLTAAEMSRQLEALRRKGGAR